MKDDASANVGAMARVREGVRVNEKVNGTLLTCEY